MDQATRLCRSLMERHHDRSSFVVALGGGVIGDLAGFVASIFYRGIPCVQIPTTIIAQVDSSLGGKTGVNTHEGKNLIGTYHQPCLVISDPDTLTTLPRRVFQEGFAEIIKHAAIRDADMLDELEALDPADQRLSPELIARNVGIKARIVEEDERDSPGARALLNFGHTIGNAIEASSPNGNLLHGEAVSRGIRAALHLSEQVTGLKADDSQRILDLLAKFKLPLTLDDEVTNENILTYLLRDKTFMKGMRHFILLERNGHAIKNEEVTDEHLHGTFAHLRTGV
jgi:3-dehydroquinate synthase